jgi:hypothetical protein
VVFKIACVCDLRGLCLCLFPTGRSIITKKSDGSQVKESTDSSTTLEDDDVKGKQTVVVPYSVTCILLPWRSYFTFLTAQQSIYLCIISVCSEKCELIMSNVSCNIAISQCSHRPFLCITDCFSILLKLLFCLLVFTLFNEIHGLFIIYAICTDIITVHLSWNCQQMSTDMIIVICPSMTVFMHTAK